MWDSTAGEPTTDSAPTIAKPQNLSDKAIKILVKIASWNRKTRAAQKKTKGSSNGCVRIYEFNGRSKIHGEFGG